MDFPSSLKSSFKKPHARKISICEEDVEHEHQPILATHPIRSSSSDPLDDRHEVILKIDTPAQQSTVNDGNPVHGGGAVNIQRKSSFSRKGGNNVKGKDPLSESPPSMLIYDFMRKQKDGGEQLEFDIDLEMNELNLNERVSNSKDVKVSFYEERGRNSMAGIEVDDKHANDLIMKEDDSSSPDDDDEGRKRLSNICNSNRFNRNDDDQVLKCTSFQRRDIMLLGCLKTKSRLSDTPELPPLPPDRKSMKIPRSGTMKSGILNRPSGVLLNEEEDDPLFDEDLPEEYRKSNVNSVTLLQWFSLILIVAALVCSLSISEFKKIKMRGLQLWKWEVLGLVVICGRLVSGGVIRIVVFFIERNFLLRKRVLYFVYGVRRAVQNCFWLGLVLIAWHLMFNKQVEAENSFLLLVNKLMVCMVVATLLWLVKTLMVKVLASSFHVSQFFDRIQESLFNQYVIETLSGPPLIEINEEQDDEERTNAEVWRFQKAGAVLPPDLKASFPSKKQQGRTLSFKVAGPVSSKTQQEQGISIDHLHRLNPKNVSAWNMKRLINIVRHGTISTLDEQILGQGNEDETTKQIRSEREAKVAARKIFRNVAKPGYKFIHLQDLIRFLREDEAFKAINHIENSAESTKISKASLKNWVVNTFRERRALALTLNDTKTAVNQLHRMVNVLVGVAILVICVVILGLVTSEILLFMSSQVVVAAFIFGNTCKTVFEAIIFLFVMHPFDVGDRCEIDGVQLIVEEMNILNTIFLKWDNEKVMYPNSTLSTRPIGNYYRSPDMFDEINFTVHITTPPDKIALLKQRIISFIDNKKEHWYPSPQIVIVDVTELKTIKFSIWPRHRTNYQDNGERYERRGILADEMTKIFKELDIEYRLYPLDINIRSMPPSTSTRIPTTWQAS